MYVLKTQMWKYQKAQFMGNTNESSSDVIRQYLHSEKSF